MMVYLRYILLFLIIAQWSVFDGNAQQENIWAFGLHAGLDFTTGVPVPIETGITTAEGCASVCDHTGRLLFYTNGSLVWDRNNNLMLNGTELCPFGTASTTQGAVIVPMPDSTNKYYVFSMSQYEAIPNQGKLFYSIVNMDLNNGLGDVEPDRKAIQIAKGLTEHMTAVAGDKCNIWLLTVDRQDSLKAFYIDNEGIDPRPVITPIQRSSNFSNVGITGSISASPDRRRIAIARTNLVVYDFDPYTGIASNAIVLDRGTNDNYSVCFSPDNSKVYTLSGNAGVDQFDLSSNDSLSIFLSKVSLSSFLSWGSIKLAPDNKLYICKTIITSSADTLDVINFPNLPGIACQYIENAVPLFPGTKFGYGLPNVIPVQHKKNDTFFSHAVKDLCFITEIEMQAQFDGRRYVWSTGDTGKTLIVNHPGSYIVSYKTDPCMVHVDSFTVHFNSRLPRVGTYTGCRGDSKAKAWTFPATDDTIVYTYTWHADTGILKGPIRSNTGDTLFGITPGMYSLQIAAPNSCDTTLQVKIDTPAYKVSFTADTVVCQNESMQFTNTSTGDITGWTWFFGDGQTSASQSPSHFYSQPGSYQVVLVGHNDMPCYDTVVKRILVDTLPVVSFIMDNDSICEGIAVNFHPKFSSGVNSLIWNFGNGNLELLPEAASHSFDGTGVFFVTLTGKSSNCQDTSFKDSVTIYPSPLVDLGRDTSLCVIGDAVLLSNHSSRSSGDMIIWNTGDTTQSILAKHHGLYVLTVTSNYGCATTDSIEVFKKCYLDVPNAFTPDGDGINDYFLPRGVLSDKLIKFHMVVLNRWGQAVFKTEKLDGRGWDGSYNVTAQPSGVYVYLIEIEFTNNYKEKYQGNVTLLR